MRVRVSARHPKFVAFTETCFNYKKNRLSTFPTFIPQHVLNQSIFVLWYVRTFYFESLILCAADLSFIKNI